ncbi:MAG: hypothetical protein WC498_01055 [Candidatus Saccharimonadales bacterium]
MTTGKELVLVARDPSRDWESFARAVLPVTYGERLATILSDMQTLADETGEQPRTSAALGLLALADSGAIRIVERDETYILFAA